MRRGAEFQLLRHVPGSSPVHRLWAGTKLVCLGAVAVAVTIWPSWPAVGVLAAVVGLGWLLSRVPASALPRPPRWFWIGLLIGLVFSFAAGESPDVEIGGASIGVGDFLDWAQFTSFAVLIVLGAALVGWTTALADVGPAVGRLLRPLRPLRVPVDDMALAVSLGVRCLPLLADEVRTLYAAWRMRRPVAPVGLRARMAETHGLLVTALVSAVRRATELAEAIDARGGPGTVPPDRTRLGWRDAVALTTAAGAVTLVVLA